MLRNQKSLRILRNLVLAEIIFYGVFLIVALSAYWAQIYRQHFMILARYISFTVLEFTFLAASQVVLISFVLARTLREADDIQEVIRAGEHERAEFKSSFRWDMRRGQVNKDLERSVMKTIAAFLNSEGGSLVIGVDDHRQISGLEPDLNSLVKKNLDGFENHFNNIFVAMLGPEFRRFVKLSFHDLEGQSVCLVNVNRAHRPAYLKTDGSEDYFIRTGNATTALKISEVAGYVSSWRD